MNEAALLSTTPEPKTLLKPSPKSPSRSSRKKSAAENKYVEGVRKYSLKKLKLATESYYRVFHSIWTE